jgi:hypothetical protein
MKLKINKLKNIKINTKAIKTMRVKYKINTN